eukprot:362018-Chlamydomonas_euryale.AAC.14
MTGCYAAESMAFTSLVTTRSRCLRNGNYPLPRCVSTARRVQHDTTCANTGTACDLEPTTSTLVAPP